MADVNEMPNGKMVLLALAFMTKLNVQMEKSYDRGDDRSERAKILEQMFGELGPHELVTLDMAFDFLVVAVKWLKVMVPNNIRSRWPEGEYLALTEVIDSEEKFQELVAKLREKYNA